MRIVTNRFIPCWCLSQKGMVIKMNVQDAILTRRSVRKYQKQPIETWKISKMIESAIWAPSGKNGQPWKFKIVSDTRIITTISNLSIYKTWLKSSPCFIVVFIDKEKSYHYVKDVQSCGAAIQNIMLSAHELGVGSCWIGELLSKERKIKEILGIQNEYYELMAIIALGYAQGTIDCSSRKDISDFLL